MEHRQNRSIRVRQLPAESVGTYVDFPLDNFEQRRLK